MYFAPGPVDWCWAATATVYNVGTTIGSNDKDVARVWERLRELNDVDLSQNHLTGQVYFQMPFGGNGWGS